jgi:hypothetical protein
MKKNKLTELTIDELSKEKSSIKGVLIGTAIVMLILCGAIFYLANRKQNFGLMAIVPCCLLTMLPATIRLSQINAEIKSRN